MYNKKCKLLFFLGGCSAKHLDINCSVTVLLLYYFEQPCRGLLWLCDYLLNMKQLHPTWINLVSSNATIHFEGFDCKKNRNDMTVLVVNQEVKVYLCSYHFSSVWLWAGVWPFEVSYVCCCLAAPVMGCYYLSAVCEPGTAVVVCSAVVERNNAFYSGDAGKLFQSSL